MKIEKKHNDEGYNNDMSSKKQDQLGIRNKGEREREREREGERERKLIFQRGCLISQTITPRL